MRFTFIMKYVYDVIHNCLLSNFCFAVTDQRLVTSPYNASLRNLSKVGIYICMAVLQ